jgi:hypothetical protein
MDHYAMNLPTEEVGHNGAILLTCRRCGFRRPVRRERIEGAAREAAAGWVERLAVTVQGEFLPITSLTPAHKRRHPPHR